MCVNIKLLISAGGAEFPSQPEERMVMSLGQDINVFW